jgi:hypothetical protein
MYLRAKSNDFVSLYVLAIEFFNYSESEVLFCFFLLLLKIFHYLRLI